MNDYNMFEIIFSCTRIDSKGGNKMKLKIAIISKDDDFLKSSVNALISLMDVAFNVFHDSKGIFEYEEHFDIILVDFETTKEEEIEINKSKYYKDSLIVFATSQPLFSYKKITLRKHLLMFITKTNLHVELLEIITKMGNDSHLRYLTVKSGREMHRLYLNEILTIYPEDHYLNFVFTEKTIRVRMFINEISAQLRKNDFILVKNSTYVNLQHMIRIIPKINEIVLSDGSHVKYSRYNYKEISKRFMEHL